MARMVARGEIPPHEYLKAIRGLSGPERGRLEQLVKEAQARRPT